APAHHRRARRRDRRGAPPLLRRHHAGAPALLPDLRQGAHGLPRQRAGAPLALLARDPRAPPRGHRSPEGRRPDLQGGHARALRGAARTPRLEVAAPRGACKPLRSARIAGIVPPSCPRGLPMHRSILLSHALALAVSAWALSVAPAHALEMSSRRLEVAAPIDAKAGAKLATDLMKLNEAGAEPVYLLITASGGSAQGVL